jgi:hypothetical protein
MGSRAGAPLRATAPSTVNGQRTAQGLVRGGGHHVSVVKGRRHQARSHQAAAGRGWGSDRVIHNTRVASPRAVETGA